MTDVKEDSAVPPTGCQTLSGLCYLYSNNKIGINFTGFGEGRRAEITYVNNESHLGQLLKRSQYNFIILDSANGRSDYTRLFGSLCHTFGKYRPKDKSFPVSVIDETDKMRQGLLRLGESFGLKVVFGTRNGGTGTIDTNLAKILEEN